MYVLLYNIVPSVCLLIMKCLPLNEECELPFTKKYIYNFESFFKYIRM